METIYLMVYFMVPGLVAKYINSQLKIVGYEERKGLTVYEKIFSIVSYSSVSFFITLVGMNCIIKNNVTAVDVFLYKSNSFKFIFCFLIVEIIIATILMNLLKKKITTLFFKIRNKKSEKEYNTKQNYIDDRNVWESIFYNGDGNILVSIWQNRELITVGFISGWNSGRDERKELILERTTEITKMMEDKSNVFFHQDFDYIEKEYFDIETGLLIKVHDGKTIVEHWNDY